jgi:transcriptional regulator with XRE-family HTH domain
MLKLMKKQERAILAKRIGELRESRGMTQAELANRAGIAVRTISRIECGDTVPGPKTTDRISRALGVESESILRSETVGRVARERAAGITNLDVRQAIRTLLDSSPETDSEKLLLQYSKFSLTETTRLWVLYLIAPEVHRQAILDLIVKVSGSLDTNLVRHLDEIRDLLLKV